MREAPRQTVLLSLNVYALLAEVLEGEPGVVIDGGANVGEATRAMRRAFPSTAIHAFEPVDEAFARLVPACRDVGAAAHRLALGDADADAVIHVNANLWTCSLLPANERAHAFHPSWCTTVREQPVRVTRLDTWAAAHGVDRVALLKLDLQGYELPALRGAGGLLDRTAAVYAEAQLTPEYDGASTFADLDAYLRQRGFGLYQITDLCLKGGHAEPSCCDALYLRADVLERVRAGAAPVTLASGSARCAETMADALRLCRARGHRTAAIYGAGAHTVACAGALAEPPVRVRCVIDDARPGGTLWGLPVITRDAALADPADVVVISSDRWEAAMLERCGPFLAASVDVVTLYAGGGPRLHAAVRPRAATA